MGRRGGPRRTNAAYSEGCADTVDWTGAIITHLGDYYPGDGLQDLIARMGDGKLFIYPGDGYGGFNTCARQEIMLPSGAPDPAGIDQIVSAGHITGDGRPDMFATAGTTLWAFTGYTGGSFSSATALNTGSAWSSRDIISVGDMTGDGVADMIYRTLVSGKLYLRQGSAATTGVDLGSLATGSASANKADSVYSDSGWDAGTVSRTLGTPDVTGDGIPDLWAQMTSDGSVRLYTGGKATLSTTYTTVIGSWTGKVAFG